MDVRLPSAAHWRAIDTAADIVIAGTYQRHTVVPAGSICNCYGHPSQLTRGRSHLLHHRTRFVLPKSVSDDIRSMRPAACSSWELRAAGHRVDEAATHYRVSLTGPSLDPPLSRSSQTPAPGPGLHPIAASIRFLCSLRDTWRFPSSTSYCFGDLELRDRSASTPSFASCSTPRQPLSSARIP